MSFPESASSAVASSTPVYGVSHDWPHSDYLHYKDMAINKRVIARNRRDAATSERDRAYWENQMAVCGRQVGDWTVWLGLDLDRCFNGDNVLL